MRTSRDIVNVLKKFRETFFFFSVVHRQTKSLLKILMVLVGFPPGLFKERSGAFLTPAGSIPAQLGPLQQNPSVGVMERALPLGNTF